MIDDPATDRCIRHALAAPPGVILPSHQLLALVHTRRRARRWRRPFVAGLVVAGVVALGGGGAALASRLLSTVPVVVNVTHPQPGATGAGGPVPGVHVALPYTTSFSAAQRAAGFHILTLPASRAQLDSVTVIPPTTDVHGKPVTPDELLKPSVDLLYRYDGMNIEVVEDPAKPATALHVSVKWYGAAATHTSVVDGIHLVYSGTADATYFIELQTTDGLVLILHSDYDSTGRPLSVAQWVSLVEELS